MKLKDRHSAFRRATAGVLSTAVAAAVFGAALPARASSLPALHVIEVGDSVLAKMRGKFVASGQIVYFGVQMTTEFNTSAGASYQGGLYVGINRRTMNFRPTMTVYSMAHANDNGTSSGQTRSADIQAGGLNQVSGVSQSVQVTGDGNAAANQVTMNVSRSKGASGPTGSGWQPGTAQADSTGGQVQTWLGHGSAGVGVTVAGQGIARQDLVNALGLRQQLQLSGNLNRVMNQMNLDVGVQAATAQEIARVGMASALAALRNLPSNGRF